MRQQVRIISERQGAANSYLVGSDRLLLIDAGFSPRQLERLAGEEAVERVSDVILTHGHYDHIAALADWQSDTSARVIASEGTGRYLADEQLNLSHLFGRSMTAAAPDRLLADGETLDLSADDPGAGLRMTAYLCPGHTAGDTILLLREGGEPIALFTGDVLFSNSVGRTDFPGGSAQVQDQTMRRIVSLFNEWPEELPVYPGHGAETTITRLKRENPWIIAALRGGS